MENCSLDMDNLDMDNKDYPEMRIITAHRLREIVV